MYSKISIILTILYLIGSDLYGQQHFVRNYTTADGLHSNACTFVKVDNYGYVWIGSKSGIITRYDVEFNTYFIENEERYNTNCLDIDKVGDVWLGNNEKGIAVWAQRQWFFFDRAYGFYSNTKTKGIFCDEANSEIALAIRDTLRIYDVVAPRKIGTSFKSIPLPGIIKLDRLNENSAIVTTSRGIYLYEDQKLSLLSLAFIKGEIIDVDEIAVGRLVITTANEVCEVSYRNSKLTLVRRIPFNHTNNFTATCFENNKLYTAAKGEGIFLYDFNKGITHVYNKSNGLNELDISAIAADKEGYVYISTEEHGVSILGLDYVLNFQNVEAFNAGLNTCVFVNQDSSVWVGKQKEQIFKYKNGISQVYTIKGHDILSLFEYENLIYATTNFGLYYLQDGAFIKDKRFPSSNCSGNLVDSQQRLWLAFADNVGIYCLSNRQIKIYEPGKLGLPMNITFIKIAEGPNQTIAFATKNKCLIFNGSRFQSISDTEWKNISINDFDFDDNGTMWIGANNGLYTYSDNKLQKVNNILDSLFGSKVLAVNFVKRRIGSNKIFAGTKEGVFELLITKSKIVSNTYFYNEEYGLGSPVCIDKSAYVTNTGDFYFATQSGVYHLPANHDVPINYFYDVFLSYIKVKYDDAKNFKAENYFLNRNDRKFRFEIESGTGTFELNLRNLSKVYRIAIGKSKLSPDESAWLFRNTTTFSYGFLSPGLHTFEYQAYNRFKRQFEPPITIELYFKGKWYQNSWFFIAVFFLLAIGFFFILRSFRVYDKERVYKYNLASDALNFKSSKLVLIVGAIFLPASAFIFKIFEPGIDNLYWLNVFIGSVLGVYYVLTIFNPQLKKFSNLVLEIGLYLFTFMVLFLCYYTKLHPYYFIGLLLIVFASLSILNYVESIKRYLITFCCSALIVYFSVEITTYSYNKNLFIIGILFTIIVLIMNLVLKLNVQERLLFSNDIVNNSSSLVMSGDLEGNIKFSSDNFESILGYTKEEIHSGKWWEISALSVEDAERNKTFVLEQVKEHEPYVRPVRTKSGEFKYIQWVDKKINENLVVSVGQDITDRKELEDKFQFLLQNAEDGFFQTNEKGLLIFITDKILDITGLEKDQVVGTYYHDLIRADYSKRIIKHYMRQLKDKVLASYIEFPVRRQDSKEVWVGQTAKMVYSDDGKFLGFIAVTRDITDKRKVEEIIKQTNKDFNDNLIYSKHMQNALLPNHTNLQKYLKHIFQVAIPRDIVSGDFSFIERLDKHLIIAVGDCTGHGFTGAFMTVLGTNILRTLVNRKALVSPSEMLIELDSQIDQSLNKDSSDSDLILRDGMEIGICVFDLEHQTMQFAGAGLSLYYAHDGELFDLQGDYKQIGNFDIDNFQYKNQCMPYQKDMNFYMFSDGFQDQFGGPLKKKFSRKRIKQVLTDMQTVELAQQKVIIEQTFLDWKGTTKQTDDFIFLGFNLNS